MKFSHEWLKGYVSIEETPARVGERLTAVGLPLDGLEPFSGDTIYDLDILTNRPDCMNHLGVAREYAALTASPLRPPSVAVPPGGRPTREVASVTIEAPDLCARYAARCVLGVRITPSPDWLRRRLESIGQRSINNVVDATNFVLWELGQPLHPFDLDRLEGRRIIVRRARAGERLQTLDGVQRDLTADMPIIADASRAVALAGIMGGAESQIAQGTKNVLLESAWFDPVAVRRTSRALGLRTDASHRFERGADLEGVATALDRAAALIAEVASGSVTAEPIDVRAQTPPERAISFRPERARHLLGVTIGDDAMHGTLERLGFTIGRGRDEAWSVVAPSFRRDVEREVDLIEEVARHRGYDAIPSLLPVLPAETAGREPLDETTRHARRALQAAGFSEAVNFAMVECLDCMEFAPNVESPVGLTNPLQASAAFLRTSLLPGLLRNLAHNLNHGNSSVRLFEVGTAFLPAAPLPDEKTRLAFVLTGEGWPSHWSLPARPTDLYDARGAIEVLEEALGIPRMTFSSDRIPFLEEGRALQVRSDGRVCGAVGEIRGPLLERRGIGQAVFGGEVELQELVDRAATVRRFRPLPRYPSVRRDLALVLESGTTFEAIERTIRENSALPVVEVEAFDLYRGPGVPAGSASLAVRVLFQDPTRTLVARDVQESIEAITRALQRHLNVRLRAAVPE